jgi:hypothetical protein
VAADRDRLQVLVNHPATVTMTIDPDDWVDVAEFASMSGRADTAFAAVLAVDHHAVMLTRNPGVYAGMNVTFPIVGF